MKQEDIVQASVFCIHHNIELSFIQSLRDYELLETILVDEALFLPVSQLARLEKIIRLHFELGINLEGIETIEHLLDRIDDMQREIVQLRNFVNAYQSHDSQK